MSQGAIGMSWEQGAPMVLGWVLVMQPVRPCVSDLGLTCLLWVPQDDMSPPTFLLEGPMAGCDSSQGQD